MWTGTILSACLNCFEHLKVYFEKGAKMDLKRKCLKSDPKRKTLEMSVLQTTESTSTMKGDMIPQLEWTKNCGKLREKFGEKKRTTIFALPQAMKRQSGLAFSSHRFTMTQEGGNNTHFPSFCFPRDMFFFYILSSFLSSIFSLLLLWVASLSLMHKEQEDTLLPEQKTQDER